MSQLANVFTALLLIVWQTSGYAQALYPTKPLHLIIPSPPGSGTDIAGRAVAQRLELALGQPLVVENKVGASGLLAAAFAAQSPPDGYVVLLAPPAPISTLPHLQKMSFDPMKDLEPITLAVRFGLVWLGREGLGAKSLDDLVRIDRADPGKITVGYSGPAGANHLAILMLNSMASTQFLPVPFKGESAAIADLMGGHVDVIVTTVASAKSALQNGKLTPLATTGAKRTEALPGVRTVAEYGFVGYEMEGWAGFFVPANTPPSIVVRLHKEITAILRAPEVRQFLRDRGAEVVANTPAEFAAYIRAAHEHAGRLIKQFNVSVQ